MRIVRKSKTVMKRLDECAKFREESKQKQAHAAKDTPYLFASERQPETKYLLIPIVSSGNRRYIPIGYMEPDVIVSNACFTISNASLYTFGILTSNVHNAWARAICGYLGTSYRYSNTIVYNNRQPVAIHFVEYMIERVNYSDLRSRSLSIPYTSLRDAKFKC